MKRRTEITIETERVAVVTTRREIVPSWCDGCAAEVELIGSREAAALAQVSERTIHHWVDAGRLHYSESPAGALYVCVASLVDARF